MLISISDLQRLNNGLLALDGYDEAVGAGDNARVVRKFFKLGEVRQTIAINLNRVKPVLEAHLKAHNELIQELSDGKGKVPDDKMPRFTDAYQKMLASEQEVDLMPIKISELALDDNPIPGSVLAAIAPVIGLDPKPSGKGKKE